MAKRRPTKIKSWDHFLEEVNRYDNGWWGFRGVSSVNYELIPSIGRKTARYSYSKYWERQILDLFKQQAIPHLTKVPPTELAWLAVARHHGLPTRLLDWSLSPLVAAYFAVTAARSETDSPEDCAIYGYSSDEFEGEEDIKPFSLRDDFIEVHVSHYSPRLSAQKGFFTIHRRPDRPFKHRTLFQMIIPGKLCAVFQDKLDLFGINAATLFPDLDGLGQYWGWYYRQADRW